MVLHKIVNGKKVELTQLQEKKIRSEWAANDAEKNQRIENERLKKEKDEEIKGSLKLKLKSLGLNDDEIIFLFSRLC